MDGGPIWTARDIGRCCCMVVSIYGRHRVGVQLPVIGAYPVLLWNGRSRRISCCIACRLTVASREATCVWARLSTCRLTAGGCSHTHNCDHPHRALWMELCLFYLWSCRSCALSCLGCLL